MRTLISLFAAISLWASAAYAQNPNYSTCDQFNHSTSAGDVCLSNGTQSFFYPFSGDVTNYRNQPACTQFNRTNCGKLTVTGLNGFSFNGVLADGQGWCFQLSTNSMIPCNSGGGGAGNVIVITPTSPGGDWGAKINACVAALPSVGGTCDATLLDGAQTWSTSVNLGAHGKPVTLLMGNATITRSAGIFMTIHKGDRVVGVAGGSGLGPSITQIIGNDTVDGVIVLDPADSGHDIVLSDFSLEGTTASNVGSTGIKFNAAFQTSYATIQRISVTDFATGIYLANMSDTNVSQMELACNSTDLNLQGSNLHNTFTTVSADTCGPGCNGTGTGFLINGTSTVSGGNMFFNPIANNCTLGFDIFASGTSIYNPSFINNTTDWKLESGAEGNVLFGGGVSQIAGATFSDVSGNGDNFYNLLFAQPGGGAGFVKENSNVPELVTTVAALPTCNATTDGAIAAVTDGSIATCVFPTPIVAGSPTSPYCPVQCDGTNWIAISGGGGGPTGPTGATGPNVAGTQNQILGYNNSNVLENETVSGDCTTTWTGANAYSVSCPAINTAGAPGAAQFLEGGDTGFFGTTGTPQWVTLNGDLVAGTTPGEVGVQGSGGVPFSPIATSGFMTDLLNGSVSIGSIPASSSVTSTDPIAFITPGNVATVLKGNGLLAVPSFGTVASAIRGGASAVVDTANPNVWPADGVAAPVATTSEGAVMTIAASSFSIKSMRCQSFDATGTATVVGGTNYVLALRKNLATSTLTCTITAATSVCSDTTHTVTVVAGDRIDFIDTPSGTPTALILKCSAIIY